MGTPTRFSFSIFTDCYIVDYKGCAYFIDISGQKIDGGIHSRSATMYNNSISNKIFALRYPEAHTKIIEWLKENT